jgi:tetratricopeptide (TPR) repeat protein
MESGQAKEVQQYQKIFSQAHNILGAEARAEELYGRILIHFTRSFANQPKWISLTEKFLKEIATLKQKYNTYELNNHYYNIQRLYYQLTNDYVHTLKITQDFEKYLRKNPQFGSLVRYGNLYLIQLTCHLQLGNLDEGRRVAEEAIKSFSPGTNWFTTHEQYFLLCLSQKDYRKAAELYHTAIEHPRFTALKQWQTEIWRVLGGYLYFILSYYGENALIQEVFPEQTFRLSKLLNEIPIFSKDKRGFNVAILILQFLIALQKGAFGDIISRTDALKHYVYKFLSREEAYRSHIFIRMLLVVERSSFDPEVTRQKTKTLLSRLKEKNINYNPTQSRIEIIPYEELWEMIMVMLEKQK